MNNALDSTGSSLTNSAACHDAAYFKYYTEELYGSLALREDKNIEKCLKQQRR